MSRRNGCRVSARSANSSSDPAVPTNRDAADARRTNRIRKNAHTSSASRIGTTATTIPRVRATVSTVAATDVPTSANRCPDPDSASNGVFSPSPTRGMLPTESAAPDMLSRNESPADVSPSAGARSVETPSWTSLPSHTHTATKHSRKTSATIWNVRRPEESAYHFMASPYCRVLPSAVSPGGLPSAG